MISTSPRVGPLISVVTPRTISWWAWWDSARSKGDLRSLMVRMNSTPRNTRPMVHTAGCGSPKAAATSKEPVTWKNATAMSSTMGS